MKNNFKNLYNKKEKIFYGSENNYFVFTHNYPCPHCSSELIINPLNSKKFDDVNDSFKNKIVGLIKGLDLKDTPAFFNYYTYNGIGLCQDIKTCSNQHKFLIVTANGEYQPGRYMVINLGIFAI